MHSSLISGHGCRYVQCNTHTFADPAIIRMLQCLAMGLTMRAGNQCQSSLQSPSGKTGAVDRDGEQAALAERRFASIVPLAWIRERAYLSLPHQPKLGRCEDDSAARRLWMRYDLSITLGALVFRNRRGEDEVSYKSTRSRYERPSAGSAARGTVSPTELITSLFR